MMQRAARRLSTSCPGTSISFADIGMLIDVQVLITSEFVYLTTCVCTLLIFGHFT